VNTNSSNASAATVNGRDTPPQSSQEPAVTMGTSVWASVTWKLTNVQFNESEKSSWAAVYGEPAGADFRIEATLGVAIRTVSLSTSPPSSPLI
jgi:hypothetical protein